MEGETQDTAENGDTFEFEINQSPFGGADRAGGRRRRGVALGTTLTLVVILTLVIAVHGAASPPQPLRSTPSAALIPSAGTTPSTLSPFEPPPDSALGALPAGCPAPAVAPRQITYGGAPAFGGSPVWVVGLSLEQNRRVVHFERFPALPYTRYGWRWRILLVSAPGSSGLVTLFGEQTDSGAGTSLLLDKGAGLVPILSLNPRRPTMRGLGWAEWPIYVYLPRSGCYELGAHWPGGSWRISFAAGV